MAFMFILAQCDVQTSTNLPTAKDRHSSTDKPHMSAGTFIIMALTIPLNMI